MFWSVGGYFSARFTMTNGHNNVWHHPQTGVSPFKLSLSIHLRTLCPQWSPITHLVSITSVLFPIQRRGECPSRLRAAASRSPPMPSVCFQQFTNCPICKSFTAKSLQQCGECVGEQSVQHPQSGGR